MDRYASSDLDQLAYELFRKFARIEYALKAAGFHKGPGKAEPNWDTFASSVRGQLTADAVIAPAIKYMNEQPPKQQVVRNGLLEWETAPRAKSETHELLLCVRRVRNNLLHGGKFNGHWFAPERSEPLLRYSLDILNACLRASPELREAFESE